MTQPTGGSLALEVADQSDDIIHVVETLQLPVVVDDLHRVFNHLQQTGKRKSLEHFPFIIHIHFYRSWWQNRGTRLHATFGSIIASTSGFVSTNVTYIVQEFNNGICSQLSVVLNYFIVCKDVDAVDFIQTWWEKKISPVRKSYF